MNKKKACQTLATNDLIAETFQIFFGLRKGLQDSRQAQSQRQFNLKPL